MKNKSILDFLTVSIVLTLIGLIVIIAGMYYKTTREITSGVTMNKHGSPYGTGTLDGNGMIFCGVLFLGFGYAMRDKDEDKPEK